MCDIHIHPDAKIVEIAALKERMNLRVVATTDGGMVLRTPNHERLEADRRAREAAKNVVRPFRWTRRPVDRGPEPPDAA